MKYGNEFNARKVDAPAMSSEASVANNFLRGVISTDSLTKNYRSVQRYSNLLSESMLTNSQSGVNHRYFTVAVGQREIVYATLPSKLKSKCTSVKGKMILFPSFSMMPEDNMVCISRCTALKSRLRHRDNSRIDIAPAPAIALIIFSRLGASITFVSCSMLGNTKTKGSLGCLPDMADSKSEPTLSQKLSSCMTLTVNVFMVLAPHCRQVSTELSYQIFQCRKCNRVFNITNMFVIPFACFIVITQHANAIYDVNQTVFIVMLASSNFRVDFPDFDANKSIFVWEIESFIHHHFRWHSITLHVLIDVYHNINILMMSIIPSLDHINLESYTVLAVAKSTAGIGVPFFIRALNRASGFFMGEAQLHLLFVVIMVGRAGEPQGSPGSRVTGYANPVRLTTHEIGVSSGELSKFTHEDAIMATIPTQTQPKTPNIYVSDIDLERRTHEINLLLGCASFLACNATQDARRCLVDILAIIERLTQELISLTQYAKYRANTPPATSRRRGRK